MKKAIAIMIAVVAIVAIVSAGMLIRSIMIQNEKAAIAKKVTSQIDGTEYAVKDIDGKTTLIRLQDVIEPIDMPAIVKQAQNNHDKSISNIFRYVSIDPNLVLQAISAEKQIDPQDAYIQYDEEEHEYILVPEIIGNKLKEDAIFVIVQKMQQEQEIDLIKLGCYELPSVYESNEELNRELCALNSYRDFSLTYTVDEQSEILTFEEIKPWLKENRNQNGSLNLARPFILDEKAVDEYVAAINGKYTVTGQNNTFETTSGKIIDISTESYDWIVDTEALKASIINHVAFNLSDKLELPFSKKGNHYTGKNFGGTYIEISIEDQHIWMYLDGECVKDSDVVTGNVRAKHETRKGVFYLIGKTKNTYLKGPGYNVHVNYWMPFDGGIGMHDASWRRKFGGEIYKTNGSHGCVNMPNEMAKFIYENITYETPIIVY